MYDTYLSTPGNSAKLGAVHSNIQTAQSSLSLVAGWERIYNALVSTPLSQHSNSLCQCTLTLVSSLSCSCCSWQCSVDVERTECCCSSSMVIEQSATIPPSLNVTRVLTASSCSQCVGVSCLTASQPASFLQNCSQCVSTLTVVTFNVCSSNIQYILHMFTNEGWDR